MTQNAAASWLDNIRSRNRAKQLRRLKSDEAQVSSGMFIQEEGNAVIKSIQLGGPADEAGLKVGDHIMWIFAEDAGTDADDMRSILNNLDTSGFKGVFVGVRIGVMRDEEEFEVILALKEWSPSQAYDLGVKDEVMRIAFPWFSAGVAEDVAEILETRLAEEEIKAVIFDLRDNPGGLMSELEKLSGLFVPEGTVVAHLKGRSYISFDNLTPSAERFPQIEKVGVIINENSASASEAFAAFIRDEGLGPVAGETSRGKGSQQFVIDIPKIDPFRVTVARFTGPAGTKIDNVGAKPSGIIPLTHHPLNVVFRASGFEGMAKITRPCLIDP